MGWKSNITGTFDRVVVINLARRPDRLDRFHSLLTDWPFRQPERFEAVDGQSVEHPAEWDKGPGAWGCLLSHRQALDRAISDGVRSLLILEDDACPAENFAERATRFLDAVPDDWDGLMLGAQHLTKPLPVAPGVARCTLANRAHAYAVRGRFMEVLSQFWHRNTVDHCDIVLASLMPHFKIYAPDPILIGQDRGVSDITGRQEQLRFWSAERTAESRAASPGTYPISD
jgi:GR25 family glycosyltransferase involved in LPS biosynthesis